MPASPREWTTNLGAKWRIRWWHKWERVDLVGIIGVFFGVFNAARAVINQNFAGVAWLAMTFVGVVLFAASGLETRQSAQAGPEVELERESLAQRLKRLDDRFVSERFDLPPTRRRTRP